jgi:hypothetical protein
MCVVWPRVDTLEGLWLMHEKLGHLPLLTLCLCKVRNKFLVNFWYCITLLCIPCIYVYIYIYNSLACVCCVLYTYGSSRTHTWRPAVKPYTFNIRLADMYVIEILDIYHNLRLKITLYLKGPSCDASVRHSYNVGNICLNILIVGYAVAQLVEALCYKSEGRGFDSRCCHWHNPSSRKLHLRFTQPLTEISTRNISWVGGEVKAAGV